jgi:hypothetical protein
VPGGAGALHGVRLREERRQLFFEKSTRNFCPFGVRVGATPMPYKQEFFGSFLQKRTACFLLLAASIGRLW